MSSPIAVVYLARLHEGFQAFEIFAENYRRHPAGEPHDLYIICKGFEKPGEYAAIFSPASHGFSVKDDIGLDPRCAKQRTRSKSTSVVETFRPADRQLARQALGRMSSQAWHGRATGSFESLYSSYGVVNFILGLSVQRGSREPGAHLRLADQPLPHTMRCESNTTPHSQAARRRVANRRQFQNSKSSQGEFSRWPLHFRIFLTSQIHIFSTAFMVRRLTCLPSPDDKGKIACWV